MKKRIKFIDIAKGFAILIIILGHTIVYSEHCKLIFKLLYSFNIALFFVISGYTFKSREDYKNFIKNKFNRIMVPYFIWSTLFLIPYLIFGNKLGLSSSNFSSFNIIEQFTNILIANGNDFALKQNSSLWFLPALFSMEVIYNFFINIVKKLKINHNLFLWIIILLIGYISTIILYDFYIPWGVNTVLEFGIFFYTGYLISKEENFLSFKVLLKSILLIVIGMLSCFLNYRNVSAIDYRYGIYFLAILSGLSFSFLILIISNCIKENKYLEYIGKNTIGILIFHKPLVILFQTKFGIITHYLKDSNIFIEFAISMIILFVTLCFSLYVNYLFKTIVPFTLGINRKE